jgi:CRISPR-associated Csx2 family protein
MAITFISFLGTGNYNEVSYIDEKGAVYKTKYIQSALLQKYKEILDNDSALIKIFVTQEARKTHWDPQNTLKDELTAFLPNAHIEAIDINPITTEQSIWELFNIIYNHIDENTDLLIDITHGFRSLPIVSLVIINYARFLKNINIMGIYYGAFEGKNDLGVPIIDLTQLDRLLQWNNAVYSFLNTGNAEAISLLTNKHAGQLVRETNNVNIYTENSLAKALKEIWPILSTCRSKEIINGDAFIKIKDILQEIESRDSINIKPIGTLLTKIKEIIIYFKKDSVSNILVAVYLCIKYKMVQVGITLLQEGLITILLYSIGIDEYFNRNNREAVSRYFIFLDQPGIKDNPITDEKYKFTIERLTKRVIVEEIKLPFNKLRDIRNDINHAAYTDQDIRANVFEQKLIHVYKETLTILIKSKDISDKRIGNTAKSLLEKLD